MPVSPAMVEAIAPQPGHTILDLAAGIGDTGFLAAELIEPGGHADHARLRARDARRRAARATGEGHQERPLPPDRPEHPDRSARRRASTASSAAGATCCSRTPSRRCGTRAASSSTTAGSPSPRGPGPTTTCGAQRRSRDPPGPRDPRADRRTDPGQFTWADPNLIIETMEAAGFVEPEVDAVDFVMRFADFDDWWVAHDARCRPAPATRTSRWTSPRAATCWPSSKRPPSRSPQPDDRLEIPARTWVATATA